MHGPEHCGRASDTLFLSAQTTRPLPFRGGPSAAFSWRSINLSEARTQPDFGPERGLFDDIPTQDRAESTGEPRGLYKNSDFLRFKDEALFLLDPRPGKRILDVGCSVGAQMVYCGLQGAEVYGQDLSASSIAEANEKLTYLGLKGQAKQGDATSLQFEDGFFDGVISSDFHEHLTTEQQIAVLKESHRVLKPGGALVVKTPNLSYLRTSLNFKRVRALVRGQDPRGFVIPHTPGTWDPQHVGLTNRAKLSQQMSEASFDHVRFFYAPLARLGRRYSVDVASTEVPGLRDLLSPELLCRARKPIALSYFPD